MAKRRFRSAILRLLVLAGVVAGVRAVLLAAPSGVNPLGHPRTPPSGEALNLGFEPKDIGARDTALILLGMALTTAVVIGIVFVMIWQFHIARTASWSAITPQQTAQMEPPAPHLQVVPFADLAEQRARETRLLDSYGWTSADHSTARIPLDRAMALTVGKSLDPSP